MTVEPGFYQSHLKGRASGRVSPREAVRPARREQVLANHGLLEQGQADPNQGPLFSLAAAGIPTIPAAAIARQRGVAPPLASSVGGFMPGIQRNTRAGTVKAKVNAVNKMADARVRTGTSRGGAPIKETMEDRAALYDMGKPADWYQPVSNGRNVMGEGMARTAIDNAALRTRTTNTQMTRAAALTSPRTAWDEGGAPGTTDYVMPNVQSAENVVRALRSAPDGADPRTVGAGAEGSALNGMKAKAAEYHAGVPTSSPIRVVDPSSQKVPNFEQSLHMSHVDPEVVRGASGSYTVDGWDAKGIGGDEKLLKSDTGYAVAHMTGQRAAMKAGELGPNFQARTWNSLRDSEQPASMGTNRLFVSKRSGALAPNPNAMAPERVIEPPAHQSRAQRRGQSTADKYDLEF
jgi:hypothetical protein